MKKLFYIISIIAGLYSCEQNPIEEITPEQVASASDEKIPVTFQMTFPELIDYGTDLVPMSRAATDTIKTYLANKYNAIIIKKIDDKWFIDTVIKDQRIDKDVASYDYLKIKGDTSFSPIQIDLRPGTYKMGLFLGVNKEDFNEELKKGFLVSSTPDILPGLNLPVAFFAHFAGKPGVNPNDPPEGTYAIRNEIFAGMVSFTVSKDPALTTKGANIPLNVALQRKVSRFRFLLKKTALPVFYKTAYRITFTLKAENTDNPFCNGLDVLGGIYYDPSNPIDQISLVQTNTSTFHMSEVDNESYQMALSIPRKGGSSTFGPFIMMDRPIDFILTMPKITGQDVPIFYECKDVIPLTLQPNSLIAPIFFVEDIIETDEAQNCSVRYLKDSKANQLFHPYFEWNAIVE